MNNEAHIVMRSPVRTASLRQLNVHPSTMLWPKEAPCAAPPRTLVEALGAGRSCRVQTIATRENAAWTPCTRPSWTGELVSSYMSHPRTT